MQLKGSDPFNALLGLCAYRYASATPTNYYKKVTEGLFFDQFG